jgi:tetratricopeptide (TPR) repeat protein
MFLHVKIWMCAVRNGCQIPRPAWQTLAAAFSLVTGVGTCNAHNYTGLIDDKRYVEAEIAIHARLATDPRNGDALSGAVDLILAQGQGERLDDAGRLAQQCVAANPRHSECREANTNVLAARLARSGVMDAVLNSRKVRDAYLDAITFDPRNFRARLSLLRFYLGTPMALGGSNSRARELSNDTGRINPDVSILMQAICDADDGKLFKAEGLALSVNLSGAESVLPRHRDLLFSIATQYNRERRYADATRVATELRNRFPMSELGYYALGMTAQSQGKHAEALALFDSALSMAPRANIYYRVGLSMLARHDKNGAGMAFEKALNAKPALGKQQHAEVVEKLEELLVR